MEINGELFEVTMTEYDDGIQRPMGKKIFTSEREAKDFCGSYNSGTRECYWRATYRKVG